MSLLIRHIVVGRYVANDITLQRHCVLLPLHLFGSFKPDVFTSHNTDPGFFFTSEVFSS